MRDCLNTVVTKVDRKLQFVKPSEDCLDVKVTKLDVLSANAMKLLRHGCEGRVGT